MLVLYRISLAFACVPIVLYLIALCGWFLGMPILVLETSAWIVNNHVLWLFWSPILFAISLLVMLVRRAAAAKRLVNRGLTFAVLFAVSFTMLFAIDALFQRAYDAVTDIRITNDSPVEIGSLRIVGAGIDLELGPIAASDSVRLAFFALQEGELTYRVTIGRRTDSGTIADLISPEKGSCRLMTFDSTGAATVVSFWQLW